MPVQVNNLSSRRDDFSKPIGGFFTIQMIVLITFNSRISFHVSTDIIFMALD